jgi:ankyrin repeat protein
MNAKNWIVISGAASVLFLAAGLPAANAGAGSDAVLDFLSTDHRPAIERIADDPAKFRDEALAAGDVNRTFEGGRTLLHFAAHRGYADVVAQLLGKGAKIDAQDKDGRTPLHEAMSYNRDEAVKVLLDKGADPNRKDNEGNTPFLAIVYKDGRERVDRLADLFLSHGFDVVKSADAKLVNECILRGHGNVAMKLLDKGARTDAASLSIAAAKGHEPLFRRLLDGGADPKRAGILHEACEAGNPGIVRALLERGASPSAADIDFALYKGHREAASLMNEALAKAGGKPVDLKSRCDMKPAPGNCKALFWNAYYDAKARKCVEYSGCGGTVPFDTLEGCKAVCE